MDDMVMDCAEFVCGNHGLFFNKKKRFAKHIKYHGDGATILDNEGIIKIQFGGQNGEYIVVLDKDRNTVVTMESPHSVQWMEGKEFD